MKHALLLGCGSSNGSAIVEALIEHGFAVTNVGSSEYQHNMVRNIKINWKQLDIESVHKIFSKFDVVFDFVFFNHNNSSLALSDFDIKNEKILKNWRLVKDWTQSQWLSCQLPFLVLHTIRNNLNKESKVGWMLSSYINYNNQSSVLYPDYSSYKYFNYLAMKCFGQANDFQTFGIYPDFKNTDSQHKLKTIIDHIVTADQLEHQDFKF